VYMRPLGYGIRGLTADGTYKNNNSSSVSGWVYPTSCS
jgi:hypothetical protein